MKIRERLTAAAAALRERRRRRWDGAGRVWLEVRGMPAAADKLQQVMDHVAEHPAVRWVRWNAPFQRLVIAHEGEAADIVHAVQEAERCCGLENAPFAPDPPLHPADQGPRSHAALRALASSASVLLGGAVSTASRRMGTAQIDLLALTQALEHVPQLRRRIDRTLGSARADLALGLMSSASAALAGGTTGQAVDLVYRVLHLRELAAQREVWAAREEELAGQPTAHPKRAIAPGERPCRLPPGPIERYSEQVGVASLGGFGFGVAATGRADEAAASILGGAPKPARMGREAFAAMLATRLTRSGIVVMDGRALRRLDRITTVVLPEGLLARSTGEVDEVETLSRRRRAEIQLRAHRMLDPLQPEGERIDGRWRLAPLPEDAPEPARSWMAREDRSGRLGCGLWYNGELMGVIAVKRTIDPDVRGLVAKARALGLTVVVQAQDRQKVAWVKPDRWIPGRVSDRKAQDLDDRRTQLPSSLLEAVRALQREDHGVLLVGLGHDDALAAADVSLAAPADGTPWGAHLVATDLIADLGWLLQAVAASRKVASQSVAIAAAEAAAGFTFTLELHERPSTLRRILVTSGMMSLLSTLNGVRVGRSVRRPQPSAPGEHVPWHALEPDEVLARLESRPEGLSAEQAAARREEMPAPPTALEDFTRAAWGEITNPFTPVLATGAGLSAITGSALDAGLVASTMVAGSLISAWQQVQGERSMRDLEQRHAMRVKVRREGQQTECSADELVPGDIIELIAGDRVPADCRILSSERLELDESSLTGESLPVAKGPEPSFAGVLAERTSMLYADTTVAAGSAQAIVVASLGASESRRTQSLRRRAGGVHARLEQLTELTGPAALGAGIVVAASGLGRSRPAGELVESAVSLAVAAVPETLPLLASAAQVAAARRLAQRGALVTNVAAVEALGRVDVLCADKTGTLTEGVLSLAAVSDGERHAPLDELDEVLREILTVALLATPAADADGALAHPTDRALLDGARVLEGNDAAWERVAEIPFEPDRGYHATLARHGSLRLCVKGAPEVVIALCDRAPREGKLRRVGASGRAQLLEQANALAEQGMRVLAVAERSGSEDRTELEPGDVSSLVFRGFVAIADPVRPQALASLEALRKAGVDVMMLTGDHPATARAIASQLGLRGEVATGDQLASLSDEELADRLQHVRVFARVTPQLKVRIVAALQSRGKVVAMTGDGANDAAAIRLADVGVALGERATDAARASADVLVVDERIETLVDAVLEGRAMWASVRDAVSVLLGGNLGELGFALVGGLVEGRVPLGTRQLMLVNLLTDAIPALTIAVRPPAHTTPERLMGEGPERSLGAALSRDIGWRATVTGTAAIGSWFLARPLRSPRYASSVALLSLVGTQLGQTLWLGWRNPPVAAAALLSGGLLLVVVETPGLSRLAGCTPVGPLGLLQVGAGVTCATVVAGTGPQLWAWAESRFALGQRVRALRDEEWVRWVAESRLLQRVRSSLQPVTDALVSVHDDQTLQRDLAAS
jgi:cation-transporting ATPase I